MNLPWLALRQIAIFTALNGKDYVLLCIYLLLADTYFGKHDYDFGGKRSSKFDPA